MTPAFDPARHSAYSDPGTCADLLAAVPPEPSQLSAVARNVIVHYWASGLDLPAATRDDVNLRWLSRILAADQDRHAVPLAHPRAPVERVQGCCRDHTLFGVGVLRHHGVQARSRVGFAGYFTPGHRHDHVIVEWWDPGVGRWVRFDPEVESRREALPDPLDMATGPGAPFESAAEAWRRYRAGEIDPSTYAVQPGSDIGGPWFIHNYVLLEVAHRYGDELLLWDSWGAMRAPDEFEDPDKARLIDRVAELLVRADAGDNGAEAELHRWYVADPRLHPGARVLRFSPVSEEPVEEHLRLS